MDLSGIPPTGSPPPPHQGPTGPGAADDAMGASTNPWSQFFTKMGLPPPSAKELKALINSMCKIIQHEISHNEQQMKKAAQEEKKKLKESQW